MVDVIVTEPCGRVLERISRSEELRRQVAPVGDILDAVKAVDEGVDDELGSDGRLAVQFGSFTCVFGRNQRTGEVMMLAVRDGGVEPSNARVVAAGDL